MPEEDRIKGKVGRRMLDPSVKQQRELEKRSKAEQKA